MATEPFTIDNLIGQVVGLLVHFKLTHFSVTNESNTWCCKAVLHNGVEVSEKNPNLFRALRNLMGAVVHGGRRRCTVAHVWIPGVLVPPEGVPVGSSWRCSGDKDHEGDHTPGPFTWPEYPGGLMPGRRRRVNE